MNILVLNGSPKGKNSTTLQTILYLEKRYPKNNFTILNVGQAIKSYEKDFSKAKMELEKTDLILFAYPVYTFLAPSQLHRFIELMKQNNVNIKGKCATQITTSKHFYDVTAHKFIEQNCIDFGLKYINGLSADMEDLLTTKGQQEAECYFEKLMFDINHNIFTLNFDVTTTTKKEAYTPVIKPKNRVGAKDVLVVTNSADDDINLLNMIEQFKNDCSHKVRVINIRKFDFKAGCLGCFGCAFTAKCVVKDGFDDYLRNEIQTADSIVYAFSIENHYTHSSFKYYDDRQFCNGHRAVTTGMPVGYIISGDYKNEQNVKTLVEARSEVGDVYLCGVATDQDNTEKNINSLALSIDYALENKMIKPSNFYGVGGTKIFRDMVYLMQGMMKADHLYYKKHGIYDFPQKKKGKILMFKMVGAMMSNPKLRKKLGNINDYITKPYVDLLANAKPKE